MVTRQYSWVIVGIAFFVAIGINFAYTAYSQHKSEHAWCDTFRAIEQPDPNTPQPTTPRAIAFQKAFHKLAVKYGCE